MIPPEPTEILDAEARLLICLDHLAEVLALALALERDPILRVAVAGAPCLLALGSDGPYLGYAAGELTDHGTLAGEGQRHASPEVRRAGPWGSPRACATLTA